MFNGMRERERKVVWGCQYVTLAFGPGPKLKLYCFGASVTWLVTFFSFCLDLDINRQMIMLKQHVWHVGTSAPHGHKQTNTQTRFTRIDFLTVHPQTGRLWDVCYGTLRLCNRHLYFPSDVSLTHSLQSVRPPAVSPLYAFHSARSRSVLQNVQIRLAKRHQLWLFTNHAIGLWASCATKPTV